MQEKTQTSKVFAPTPPFQFALPSFDGLKKTGLFAWEMRPREEGSFLASTLENMNILIFQKWRWMVPMIFLFKIGWFLGSKAVQGIQGCTTSLDDWLFWNLDDFFQVKTLSCFFLVGVVSKIRHLKHLTYQQYCFLNIWCQVARMHGFFLEKFPMGISINGESWLVGK